MIVGFTPAIFGRLASRCVRKNRHEAAAWLAVLGTAIAALPLGIMVYSGLIWDALDWTGNFKRLRLHGETLYFLVLIAALLWGFLDCLIRFVRLVAWDMRRGPSHTYEAESSDEENHIQKTERT